METTKQFWLHGEECEIVARVKQKNGAVVEIPMTNAITYTPSRGGFSELRIPMYGDWFDKYRETREWCHQKRGR